MPDTARRGMPDTRPLNHPVLPDAAGRTPDRPRASAGSPCAEACRPGPWWRAGVCHPAPVSARSCRRPRRVIPHRARAPPCRTCTVRRRGPAH